jgi:hypothetical protein
VLASLLFATPLTFAIDPVYVGGARADVDRGVPGDRRRRGGGVRGLALIGIYVILAALNALRVATRQRAAAAAAPSGARRSAPGRAGAPAAGGGPSRARTRCAPGAATPRTPRAWAVGTSASVRAPEAATGPAKSMRRARRARTPRWRRWPRGRPAARGGAAAQTGDSSRSGRRRRATKVEYARGDGERIDQRERQGERGDVDDERLGQRLGQRDAPEAGGREQDERRHAGRLLRNGSRRPQPPSEWPTSVQRSTPSGRAPRDVVGGSWRCAACAGRSEPPKPGRSIATQGAPCARRG